MTEYLAASQRQIDGEFVELRKEWVRQKRENLLPAIDLRDEQSKWLAYRKSHCDTNVYTRWIDGTARDAFSTRCDIALTRERTRDLWNAYLRFADSTPPILPEP